MNTTRVSSSIVLLAVLSLLGFVSPNGFAVAPLPPNHVYVNPVYTPGNAEGHVYGTDAFNSIDPAVVAVAAGGTVHVVTNGTYTMGADLFKPITLAGPNAGKSATDPTRGPEAILVPSINDPANGSILNIYSSGVTIDGFLFNGDNSAMSGGINVAGADVNSAAAIRNLSTFDWTDPSYFVVWIDRLAVQNCLFTNFTEIGIYLEGTYAVNSSFNTIRDNLFANMYEAVQLYAMQGVIERNTCLNVGRGISVHSVNVAAPGFSPCINSNTVVIGPAAVWRPDPAQPRTVGIWVNYRSGSAPDLPVQGNVITTPYAVPGKEICGIQVQAISDARKVTLENNTLNGLGAGSYGLFFFDCASDSRPLVAGGLVKGWVNDGLLAATLHYEDTASCYVVVSNTLFEAGGVAIEALTSSSNEANVASITLIGGVEITNCPIGVAMSGSNALVQFVGVAPLRFDQCTADIVLRANDVTVQSQPVDATAVLFEGKLGSALTSAEGFAVEKKVTHKMDNSALGLVTWAAGRLYVVVGQSIQAGVDVTAVGETLFVEGGTYLENVTINKAIFLASDGAISGASFLVDGAALTASGNVLSGSSLSITNGATIKGTGTVGNLVIDNGGRLSPGSSPGAFNVAGSLTLGPGGHLRLGD